MALFKSFITPDSYSIVVIEAVEPEIKSRRFPSLIPEDTTLSSTSGVISMTSVLLLVLKEIVLYTIFILFLIGMKGLKVNSPAVQNNGDIVFFL